MRVRLPLADRWHLPRLCPVCDGWTDQPVCGACVRRFLPESPPVRCPRCALPSPNSTRCGHCVCQPPPWDRAFTLADYGFPWDRLITQLKYQQQPELATVLASLLAQALARSIHATSPDEPRVTVVTAMPMAPGRLARRGYNQAELIARRLAWALGLAHDGDLIRRWRESPPQASLDQRERWRQPVGTFMPAPGRARLEPLLAGRCVALVDDVVTTGATAAAATLALREAGAAQVHLWMVARTPPGGSSDNADHVPHRPGPP